MSINFSAINPSQGISSLATDDASIQSAGGENFGAMIKNAVESIDNTQKSAEAGIQKAVTGESPDIHKTIIEMQTADLKFQLGLQVRNKVIGAYEEVMRMQV